MNCKVLLLANPHADSLVVRVLEEGRAGSASHLLIVNEEVTLRWSDLAEVRLLHGNLAYTVSGKDSSNRSDGSGSGSGGVVISSSSSSSSTSGGDNQGIVAESARPNLGQGKQANKKKANGRKKGSSTPATTSTIAKIGQNRSSDEVNSGGGNNLESSTSSANSVVVYMDDLSDFHEMIQRKRQRLEAPVNS